MNLTHHGTDAPTINDQARCIPQNTRHISCPRHHGSPKQTTHNGHSSFYVYSHTINDYFTKVQFSADFPTFSYLLFWQLYTFSELSHERAQCLEALVIDVECFSLSEEVARLIGVVKSVVAEGEHIEAMDAILRIEFIASFPNE